MAFYPYAINRRFLSPSNGGSDGKGTPGRSASFACGSFVELSVAVNGEAASIEAATFRTNGCGFMTAAADLLCDWLAGKTLTELHGLNDAELMQAVREDLGPFPLGRDQCGLVVFEALRNAMARYREQRIEEFQGEKALICTCFGVSEESIADAIAKNGLTEVEQVTMLCRAGSGCGSCRMLIQELIDAGRIEPFLS